MEEGFAVWDGGKRAADGEGRERGEEGTKAREGGGRPKGGPTDKGELSDCEEEGKLPNNIHHQHFGVVHELNVLEVASTPHLNGKAELGELLPNGCAPPRVPWDHHSQEGGEELPQPLVDPPCRHFLFLMG